MDTKKRAERKSLKVYLQVFNRETDQLFGYVVDITKEGIMLTREQSVETGAIFQLKLKLSTEIEGIREFDFSATSKWCEKDPDTDFFNIGLQFADLSNKDDHIIAQLMNKFCFGAAADDESCTE